MMINRGAVLLRYKEPMVSWVNTTHPAAGEDEQELTIAELNADRTIFLVDDRDAEEIGQWIELNFRNLFETELEDWSEDQSAWPTIDRETFDAWFTVECHGVIIDTVGQPIIALDELAEDEEE